MNRRFDFLSENLRSGGWLTLPLFRLVLPAEDNSLFFYAVIILLLGMTLGRLLPILLGTQSLSIESGSRSLGKMKSLSRFLDYIVLVITSLFYLMAGYAGIALLSVIFQGVSGVTDYDRWVQSLSWFVVGVMAIALYVLYYFLKEASVLKKVLSHITSAMMIGIAVLFIYRALLFDNFQEVTQHFLYPQFSSISLNQLFVWFCLLTVTIYSSVITGKSNGLKVGRVDFRIWWSLALSLLWPIVFCLYFIDTRWSLNLLGDPLLDLGRYLLPLWLGPLLIAGLSFLLVTLSINGSLTALIKISSTLGSKHKLKPWIEWSMPLILCVLSFTLFKSFRGLEFAEGLIACAALCIWLRLAIRLFNLKQKEPRAELNG